MTPKKVETKTGVVKFFNNQKGYGFITSKDGVEYFVHATGLAGAAVQKDDNVQFELTEGKKGLMATNVLLIKS